MVNKSDLESFWNNHKLKISVLIVVLCIGVVVFVMIPSNSPEPNPEPTPTPDGEEEPTTTPEPEYTQFTQTDTEHGYNLQLQSETLGEYDHIAFVVENARGEGTSGDLWDNSSSRTYYDVQSLEESKVVLLSTQNKDYHGKEAYAIANTEDVGTLTSLPKDAQITAYGATKIENGWEYTGLESYTIQGDDPSYKTTITVDSIPDELDALVVSSRNKTYIKLTQGESITITDSEGSNVNMLVWIDTNNNGEIDNIRDEIFNPSRTYIQPSIGMSDENIESLESFSHEGLEVSVTVEKVEE